MDLTVSGDAAISISADTPGAIVPFVVLVLNVVANLQIGRTIVLMDVVSNGRNG
jgi:hypothetical protein